MTKAWFEELNLAHRDRIAEQNRRDDLTAKKSFLKRVSYNGAVRLPRWCPDDWTAYMCPTTRQQYGELGNKTYTKFMQSVWPRALEELGMSNQSNIGDLLEALLGWNYTLTIERGQNTSDMATDTIGMIERGVLAMYALNE